MSLYKHKVVYEHNHDPKLNQGKEAERVYGLLDQLIPDKHRLIRNFFYVDEIIHNSVDIISKIERRWGIPDDILLSVKYFKSQKGKITITSLELSLQQIQQVLNAQVN